MVDFDYDFIDFCVNSGCIALSTADILSTKD